jgi:hypothetical protein
MANRRLVAIITALLLMGGAGLRAEVSLEELRTMNELIDGQQWGALRDYLRKNPAVLSGDDALAQELRFFVAATERAGNGAYASLLTEAPQAPAATGVVAGNTEDGLDIY